MTAYRPSDTRERAHDLIAALLAAFVLWLCQPFGSVPVWAQSLVQIIAFVLFVLALATAPHVTVARPAVLPAALLGLIGLLGVLQARPWPADIIRTLSPSHARLSEQAVGLATNSAGLTSNPTLSLAPGQTALVALTWGAVAACLITAAGVGADVRRRRMLAAALLASGVFQVLLGSQHLTAHATSLWGVELPGDATRLRGTFVNPDHLALYLEMILALAFGWAWWGVRRARREPAPERRLFLAAPPLLVWLALFVGLAFTGSRAGLVGAAIGVIVQGLMLAARGRRWRLTTTGATLLVCGLGAVATIGLQQGFGRWLATSQYELTWSDRLQVWRQTVALWQRFPLTGTGLGTFRESFSLVQASSLHGAYWHAHNDYLEMLATAGLVGALLLAVAVVVALMRIARTVAACEASEDRAAMLAALGACAAVAVHSAFDFGLSMPANAVTLAIIVGAALGVRPRRVVST